MIRRFIDKVARRLGYEPFRVRYYCQGCNHTCGISEAPHLIQSGTGKCSCGWQR